MELSSFIYHLPPIGSDPHNPPHTTSADMAAPMPSAPSHHHLPTPHATPSPKKKTSAKIENIEEDMQDRTNEKNTVHPHTPQAN